MDFKITEKGEAEVTTDNARYFVPSQFTDIDEGDKDAILGAVTVFEEYGIKIRG